jgi:hypothetical protein
MTMAVDPRDLEELRRMETASPDSESGLEALATVPAVYGYLIACARHDGDDEADMVELLARHSGATASEVRDIAATLRRLSYGVAADRLREIAGKRTRDLRPLA